jgi:hypothetical protein
MALMGHAGPQFFAVAWLYALAGGIRSATEVGAVREQLDDRVHDVVALDEIDLYAEVLSAVAAADRPLTAGELDQVLGVGRAVEA